MDPNNSTNANGQCHTSYKVCHHYSDRAREANQDQGVMVMIVPDKMTIIDRNLDHNLALAPFPVRLHAVLDKMEVAGQASIASWQPRK